MGVLTRRKWNRRLTGIDRVFSLILKESIQGKGDSDPDDREQL
jgi:hypothetical protein